MSEAAIEQAAVQAFTPVAATLLEDLHQAASAEIDRLEKALPARFAAAEQDVQDWGRDALGALHRLIARIDGHRGIAALEQEAAAAPGPTRPAVPSTPASSTTSATGPTTTAATATTTAAPASEAAK